MKTRFLYWWDMLREQLWFIPTVICCLSLVAAVGMLSLDAHYALGDQGSSLLPSIKTTSDSARIVLGSLIGALVTVLGLVFSVTMLSVSLTTSQYGPRLVRLLFDTNITQNTLGAFLGTIVFSMIVLRSIRDPTPSNDPFTPHLSILMAEIACGVCVLVLLTFINHMMQRMRAETLIKSIYADVLAAVDRLFPECAVNTDAETAEIRDIEIDEERWGSGVPLVSRATGYLQAIDLTNLVAAAQQDESQVKLCVKPGDFIHEGTELATVRIGSSMSPDAAEEVVAAYTFHFLIGSVRTPRQDIEAGILELVEAGVRALSPGINDPMTAINVIDYLGAILRKLAQRKWPSRVIADSEGEPRVLVRTVSYASLLEAAMNQLRQNADGSVAVYCRLLEGLKAIAEVTFRSDDRTALQTHADMIVADAEQRLHEHHDLQDIRERKQRLLDRLQEAPAPNSA